MSGFTYSIAFDIEGQGALANAFQSTTSLDSKVEALKVHIGQAKTEIVGLSTEAVTGLGNVGEQADDTGDDLKDMGDEGESAFGRMRKGAMRLAAQIGILKVGYDSLKLSAEFEGIDTAIKFASGKEGEKNLNFLNQSIDALGLDVRSTTEGFKLWTGGIMGTRLEGQKGRDVFWSVSEAATAMQLSGEQSNGVFLALSQIMSKGKVQAEELRGQLGERIPGALAIAARGMNMTQAQLNKMMEDGKLMSDDFLPKFAAELHKTFGGAAVTQSQSAMANFNRMGNSVFRLKRVVGEQLLPTALALLDGFLIPSVTWIGQNIEVIGMLAVGVGSAALAYKAYNTALWISKTYTLLMTGGLWKMNAALWANPIGAVIGLVVGLGAATIYAWNKFEGFRGFLFGMWEVMKETGSILYDALIAPLLGFGKTMIGIFTFDTGLIQSGLEETATALENAFFKKGERLAKAYNKGYGLGVESFNAEDVTNSLTNFKAPDALSKAFSTTPTGDDLGKDDKLKNGVTEINQGGRSQRNITINLKDLVENISIQAKNVSEGTDEMVDMVVAKLTQVLNTANQVQ